MDRYREIYNVQFKSLLTKSYEFKILKKDYSGSSTELVGDAMPSVRYLKGDNDEIEDRILRSEIKLRVNSLTDFALLDLFTYDGKEYQGKAYCNDSLYWQGFLTPDYYEEPFVPAPYIVELPFTDGLTRLKNITWAEENKKHLSLLLNGTKLSLWGGINYCINLISNRLPLTECVNILEENHDDGDGDSAVTQSYFDYRLFNDMNCYEALDEILKACGNAQLWQQDGRWFIVSTNARKADYTARRYTLAGVYEDYTTISPEIELTDETQAAADLNVPLDGILTTLPAWKKFNLKQDFGFRENILDIYDYTVYGDMDIDKDSSSDISDQYRSAAFYDYVLKITNRDYFDPNDYLLYDIGPVVETTRQNIVVNFGAKAVRGDIGSTVSYVRVRMKIYIKSGSSFYYLHPDGSWVTGERYTFDGSHTLLPYEITSDAIPLTGELYLKIYNPSSSARYDILYFPDADSFNIRIEDILNTSEEVNIETEINDEQNYVPGEYSMMLGDLPNLDNKAIMYLGGLFWLDGSTWTPTGYWKIRGDDKLKVLANLVSDEICVNHVRPMSMISGSFRCNFKPGSVIQANVSDDRLFIMKRFTEDMYNDEWDCDLVEFAFAEQGYLKLRTGGYILMRNGNKIPLRR